MKSIIFFFITIPATHISHYTDYTHYTHYTPSEDDSHTAAVSRSTRPCWCSAGSSPRQRSVGWMCADGTGVPAACSVQRAACSVQRTRTVCSCTWGKAKARLLRLIISAIQEEGMKEMQLENLRDQYKKIFLSFSLPSPTVLRG